MIFFKSITGSNSGFGGIGAGNINSATSSASATTNVQSKISSCPISL